MDLAKPNEYFEPSNDSSASYKGFFGSPHFYFYPLQLYYQPLLDLNSPQKATSTSFDFDRSPPSNSHILYFDCKYHWVDETR